MQALHKRLLTPCLAALFGSTGGAGLVIGGSLVSPVLLLFGVIGLLGVVAVLLFPALGMLVTAFVIPIERLGRLADDEALTSFSLMRMVGLLALVSLLLHMALRHAQVVFTAPMGLYAGLCVLSGLSFFYAYDPSVTKHATITALGNLMFLFLIANGVRRWSMAQLMIYVWLTSTLLIALYQIYDWYFGSMITEADLGKAAKRLSTVWNSGSEREAIGYVRRATGTTSNAAVYGINLILALPFLLYLLKTRLTPVRRWIVIVTLFVVLYNMLLTNTRGVMLFGGLTLLICVAVGLIRLTPRRVAVLCAVGVVVLMLLPDSIYQRALDLSNYSPEKSYNLRGRFHLWGAAFEAGVAHWLTGVGAGDVRAILNYGSFEADWIGTHNHFLHEFKNLGILGLGLLVAFLVAVYWHARRAAQRFRISAEHQDHYWMAVACQVATLAVVFYALHVDVFQFPLKGWWLAAGLSSFLYHLARDLPSPAPAAAAQN